MILLTALMSYKNWFCGPVRTYTRVVINSKPIATGPRTTYKPHDGLSNLFVNTVHAVEVESATFS